MDNSNDSGSRKASSSSDKKETAPPPTPSKIMFSPGLRTEHGAQQLQHGHAGAAAGSSNSYSSDEQENRGNHDIIEEGDEMSGEETEEQQPSAAETAAAAAAEEEDYDEFNPYKFIAMLPPHASVSIRDKICLPPLSLRPGQQQELMTLALDLDETLVHCTVEPIPKPDLVFPVA
jgi:hypothetical protein